MAYILNDKIKISKPIVFLCGPYYDDTDESDRRKILQDFFLTNFPDRCLPLIIDDFLTRENIGDNSVSIQLLEEIFAGISYKTFIFLDTMSSAVELGLFTNSACNNSLYVLVPYEKERNCGNIGTFTKKVVLQDNLKRIKTLYYHPRIERIAFSTDYVGEYYKFHNNCLPGAIKESILTEYQANISLEYEIELLCRDNYPQNDYSIHYQYDIRDDSLVIFLSVKLLFYIVGGIVYSEYADNLVKKKDLDFDHYNIDNTISHLKSIIISFVLRKSFLGVNSRTQINIQTVLAKNIEDIVKHIVTFIFTYHKKARLRGYFFVSRNEVIKELDLKINPTDFFHLDAAEINLIKRVNGANGYYIRKFELKTGKKRRKIVTYNENEIGKEMRNFHEKIISVLNAEHSFSEYSFAYQKGKSIKMCVDRHKKSISFLKFDLHRFFNSIDKKKLVRTLLEEFEIDKVFEKQLTDIIDTCFVDGEMPLGLITSPVLSDIYMKEFDCEVIHKLGSKFVYTRYADDILISSEEVIEELEEMRIRSLLQTMLGSLKLSFNMKKYMKRDLVEQGDYIKYLGLNIVKGISENIITVGKAYKNYIAKSYLKYISMQNEEAESKYYFGKRIAGYLSFVRMIEGEEGLKKIYNRIEKSTQGRVIITDGIKGL